MWIWILLFLAFLLYSVKEPFNGSPYEFVQEQAGEIDTLHDKLKLKAYSKKRFDPFCRWEKTIIPYKSNQFIQTTIGQLNFFKWILDHQILDYIQEHYDSIEQDMSLRNTSKPKTEKNRKKREELSIFASKSIKKESIEISLHFE